MPRRKVVERFKWRPLEAKVDLKAEKILNKYYAFSALEYSCDLKDESI